MSVFQKKAEAQTKQIIGQVLGDGSLVEEGKEEYRHATQGESHEEQQIRDEHRARQAQPRHRDSGPT